MQVAFLQSSTKSTHVEQRRNGSCCAGTARVNKW